MSTADCLSPDELRAFILGRLDDLRSNEILTHLSACPDCEDTIASLDDATDSLIVSVRQATAAVPAPSEHSTSGSAPLAAALASVRTRLVPSPESLPADESVSRIVERVRDYELLDELGTGGMGTVYRALHTRLDRIVALKLLPGRRLRNPDAVSRFEREMKAIGRLHHPTIVRATDAGEVDGTHFLAMDFVDGIDLGKLVRLTGPLDAGTACELIRQAAVGLQYAHEQGLIHRDVKPSNLMVERGHNLDSGSSSGADTPADPSRPVVRILDLGLALFGSSSEAVDELTTVGQLMGTLDYMAPEQADNSHAVDARADIYSLGATLFKLLTGLAPYETAERCSPLQKMKILATTDAPSLASRREDLPEGLTSVVDCMLSRNPEHRYSSAADVATALTPFCTSDSIHETVEHGIHLANHLRQTSDGPSLIGPTAQAPTPEHNRQPSPADGQPGGPASSRNPRRSRGFRALLWSVVTATVVLAAVTVWIKTDTGTLKIECVDDNVPIEIRSGNTVVDTPTLRSGMNRLVIPSGRYQIVLSSQYDTLKVENDSYELRRGGEWVARVTRDDSAPAASTGHNRRSTADGSPSGAGEGPQLVTHSIQIPEDETFWSLDGGDRVDVYVTPDPPQDSSIARGPELVTELALVAALQRSHSTTLMLQVLPEVAERLRLAEKVGSFSVVLRAPGAKPYADKSITRFDPEKVKQQIEEKAARFARQGGLASAPSGPPQRSASAGMATGGSGRTAQGTSGPAKSPANGRPGRAPSPTPVFSGQTFEGWQQSVRTERNPSELKNAVMALCILGRNSRDREAAETVLAVTDAYPCEIGSSPEGELIAAAIRYLRTLDADAIVPALVDALRKGNRNTRRLIIEHLAAGVMYSGVAGTPSGGIPNTGQAEPLMSRMRQSPDFRKTLIHVLLEEKPDDPQTATMRYVAYTIVESFIDDPALRMEINTLLEHMFEHARTTVEPANVSSSLNRAILQLTRRVPRPELATWFLDNIVRPLDRKSADRLGWFIHQKPDWYGLWLLGEKAAPATARITRLLTARLPGTRCPSPVEADSLPVDPTAYGSGGTAGQPITRKLLVLDLLASIGPDARSALAAVSHEIETLTGQSPVADGDFGYEARDPRTVYQQFAASMAYGLTGNTSGPGAVQGGGRGGFAAPSGGGFFSVQNQELVGVPREPVIMAEPWLRLHAALRAFRNISGQPARFPRHPLTLKETDGLPGMEDSYGGPGASPFGSTAAGPVNESGYADMPGGFGSGPEAARAAGPFWQPRLVSYRGKTFREWTDTDTMSLSIEELTETQRAIELLSGAAESESVASASAEIFEVLMKRSDDADDVSAEIPLIRDSFRHCWLQNHPQSRERLLAATFSASPVRLALVLNHVIAPDRIAPSGETKENLRWPLFETVSADLLHLPEFQSRYRPLTQQWSSLPEVTRSAILKVESRLPMLGESQTTSLLESLLKDGTDQEKFQAALLVARGASSGRPLLSGLGYWSKPDTRQVQERSSPLSQMAIDILTAAIQNRDAAGDWVNAIPAILVLSNGRLSESLAQAAISQIIEDGSGSSSIQPFALTMPQLAGLPGGGGVPGVIPGAGGESGFGSMGVYPGTGGLAPGMTGGEGGMSGMEFPDSSGVDIHPGTPLRSFVLSRRILLTGLLSFCAHADNDLRMELAGRLTATLQSDHIEDLEQREEAESSFAALVIHWQNGADIDGRNPVKPGHEVVEYTRTAADTVYSLLPRIIANSLLQNAGDRAGEDSAEDSGQPDDAIGPSEKEPAN